MYWEALQSIRDYLTLKCELLGAVPAMGHVRRYYFPGTDLLDVSHVWNRKKLENSTRRYSGRCSYAFPLKWNTRDCYRATLLSRFLVVDQLNSSIMVLINCTRRTSNNFWMRISYGVMFHRM